MLTQLHSLRISILLYNISMEQPEHFICKGECKAISEKPGICTTEECSRKDQALELCVCEDNKHNEEVSN